MKKAGIVAGVLIVLIVGGIIWFLSQLDSQIKDAINTYGPEMTRSEVHIRSVNVSIFDGEGRLRGLFVGNPQGFETESAFKLKEIHIALDPESLAEEVIIIKNLTIDGPEVTYEFGKQSNNIEALQNNINAYIASMQSGAPKESADAETPAGPGKKIIIKDFWFKNGTVNISSSLLTRQDLSADVPDIHLQNIGGDNGTTPGRAARRIMRALGPAITSAATSASTQHLNAAGREALGGAQKQLQQEKKGFFKKLFKK